MGEPLMKLRRQVYRRSVSRAIGGMHDSCGVRLLPGGNDGLPRLGLLALFSAMTDASLRRAHAIRILFVTASREGPTGAILRSESESLTGVKCSSWRWSVALLLAAFLVACDHAGEAERLVASAEQSRTAGQQGS
jgi:hypothetical protein